MAISDIGRWGIRDAMGKTNIPSECGFGRFGQSEITDIWNSGLGAVFCDIGSVVFGLAFASLLALETHGS